MNEILSRPLNEIMEFDSVIEVRPDGSIVERSDLYAPTLLDEQLDSSDWEFFSIGYTGQHASANQPIMHNSEFIGGRLERDIREQPGVYAAIVAHWSPEDDDEDADLDVEGWAVVYQETPMCALTNCSAYAERKVRGKHLCGVHADEYEGSL